MSAHAELSSLLASLARDAANVQLRLDAGHRDDLRRFAALARAAPELPDRLLQALAPSRLAVQRFEVKTDLRVRIERSLRLSLLALPERGDVAEALPPSLRNIGIQAEWSSERTRRSQVELDVQAVSAPAVAGPRFEGLVASKAGEVALVETSRTAGLLSRPAGGTWRALPLPRPGLRVHDMTLTDAGRLTLVGDDTVQGWVLRSDDLGKRWRPLDVRALARAVPTRVLAKGNRLWLGFERLSGTGPVLVRRPAASVGSGLRGSALTQLALCAHPQSRAAVAATDEGVFATSDSKRWEELGPVPGDLRSLHLDRRRVAPRAYAALAGRVLTAELGRDWRDLTAANALLSKTRATAFGVDPRVSNWLLLGLARRGVAWSRDRGKTFTAVDDLGGSTPEGFAYRGKKQVLLRAVDGLFESPDGGRTWASLIDRADAVALLERSV